MKKITQLIFAILVVYPFSGYLFLLLFFLLFILMMASGGLRTIKIRRNNLLSTLIILTIPVYFYLLSSEDLYLLGLAIQIIILRYYKINLKADDVRDLNIKIIAIITLYSYIIIIPSVILMGPNLYLHVFNIFKMDGGSSVYISNLLSVSLCLILIQWVTGDAKKQKIEILMYLVLTLVGGFITGSRTFLIIFSLISLVAVTSHLINHKGLISRFIYPAVFSSLTLLLLLGTDNRLISDGMSTSRFLAWALALEEYKFVELHEIGSLDEKYLISAFHNIILDAFYLYGELAYFLILIYCLIIFSLIFRVTRLSSTLELRMALLAAILSSILIAFTSVVWRGDINQLVILLGMTLLFASEKMRPNIP